MKNLIEVNQVEIKVNMTENRTLQKVRMNGRLQVRLRETQ